MSHRETRLEIIRGEDRSPIIKLINKSTRDPIDLSDITEIQAVFQKSNRQDLILDTTEIPALQANIDYSSVTFLADNGGVLGNSIILSFNGSDTIAEVVSDWNTNNPTNTVQHDGTGTDILVSGVAKLANGMNAYTPISVESEVLGKIKIILSNVNTNLLKLGESQSFKVIIDWGEHPGGDRRIAKFKNRLDIIKD